MWILGGFGSLCLLHVIIVFVNMLLYYVKSVFKNVVV